MQFPKVIQVQKVEERDEKCACALEKLRSLKTSTIELKFRSLKVSGQPNAVPELPALHASVATSIIMLCSV